MPPKPQRPTPRRLIDAVAVALVAARPDPTSGAGVTAFPQWETDVMAVSLAIEATHPGHGDYRFRLKCEGAKDTGERE